MKKIQKQCIPNVMKLLYCKVKVKRFGFNKPPSGLHIKLSSYISSR